MGVFSGSAYVYHWDSSSWVEQKKLIAGDAEDYDAFGFSVSVINTNALVGAVGSDGAAYVYQWDGDEWKAKKQLTVFDVEVQDLFGLSVSISGERAIVGAVGDDDGGMDAVAAYIFAIGPN